MKNFLLSGLCCASILALLPETAHAHGGQYRGPGDTVPPGGGSGGGPGRTGGPGGPTTGGPSGPSAPAPSAPATGGPSGPSTGGPGGGPAGGRGPTTGGRGRQLQSDLTQWSFWWEFNKDPFIRLRDAVHSGGTETGSDDFYLGDSRKEEARDSLRPTERDILEEILPALKKAIDSTDQRDINSSCMIAMAKIGKDHPEFKLIDVFTPRLSKNDQEIRETAALSIGIAAIAGENEVNLLHDLALDNPKGQDVSGGAVNYRTRAFSLYGLGLMANATTNLTVKKKAFAAMKEVLEDDKIRDRNLKVAAINGMRILNIGTASEEESQFLDEVLAVLEAYYMSKRGAGEQLMQSHVPPAIAKLIGKEHKDADKWKKIFADDLLEKGKIKRSGNEIGQSCALALGQLCRPYTDKDSKKCPDGEYSKLLLKQWEKHKDVQTRNFSLLSLGFIGGELNRDALIKAFDKGGKNEEKPWGSLALGVYAHRKYEEQSAKDLPVEPERFIGETLMDELEKAKVPTLRGSLAIGLGLARYKEAADLLRELMVNTQQQEEMAGYCAIGLALMGDDRSKPAIRDVVDQSTRRFTLLQQAAIALGKLGDKRVADQLQKLMTDGEPNLAKLSAIASAIGFIGDKRTIKPLKELLFDDKLGELSRAFAAVALGGVADKEPLPWNSKIGVNMNYRAAVETLTNSSAGILDIL